MKVHFWKILRMDLELCLFTKNIIFSWSMFKFEQKCNQSRNPTDNKCLLVAWRWNIWNLVSHDFVFFSLRITLLHTYWRARDPETKPLFFSRPSKRTCHEIRKHFRFSKTFFQGLKSYQVVYVLIIIIFWIFPFMQGVKIFIFASFFMEYGTCFPLHKRLYGFPSLVVA